MANAKKNISRKPTSESKTITSTEAPAPSEAKLTTTHFEPKDLFESDNKSELFLSVTEGSINTGSGATNINLSGMYLYQINEHVQVGGQVAIGSNSYQGAGSSTSTDLYALAMYNFTESIQDSAFAFGGLGTGTFSYRGGSESKMGLKVGAGKRFPILSKVNYVPMAWFEKLADVDPMLHLVPVNFSMIF